MQKTQTGYRVGRLSAVETVDLMEGLQRMGYYNPDFEEMKRGLSDVDLLRIRKGDVLLRQEDSPDSAYLVRRGRLKVARRTGDGSERVLAEVGEFAVVGEMALVQGRPRSASVTAVEDSELYRFGVNDFRYLMESCEVFKQIVETLIADRGRYNEQRPAG